MKKSYIQPNVMVSRMDMVLPIAESVRVSDDPNDVLQEDDIRSKDRNGWDDGGLW